MGVGKDGIVFGQHWRSMMRSMGKAIGRVCSGALMMCIWRRCRDLHSVLPRNEVRAGRLLGMDYQIGIMAISFISPLDFPDLLVPRHLPLLVCVGFSAPFHYLLPSVTHSSSLAFRYAYHSLPAFMPDWNLPRPAPHLYYLPPCACSDLPHIKCHDNQPTN